MADKIEYANFKALQETEKEGANFIIHTRTTSAPVAIIAPHGGRIEPTTRKIADAIASDKFNFYCFQAIRAADNTRTLHITSNNFDEPKCLALIENCDIVVAIHGLAGSEHEYVDVGGLDFGLRDSVCAHLAGAGFVAKPVNSGGHAGVHIQNICNRGRSEMGVQLELTRALRDQLSGERLEKFATAIRAAIDAKLPG
jgi:phage replication-related protein YjqB (UPF0714/DUF867 family)